MIYARNDITVQSWSELCDVLYENSWKAELQRFRTDYAYRGLADKDYPLTTSFVRHCGTNHQKLEYHMLRNFRKYGQFRTADIVSSEWRLVTLAQHHGLPTRLLDWTYSPFVAAHFATWNTSLYNRDGVIWTLDYVAINHNLPDPLLTVLEENGSNAFTIEMIEQAVPTLGAFDAIDPGNLVLFFEPPSIDDRIVNQYAFFSVMSGPTASLADWLLSNPAHFRRIIIPSYLKWEIRDKLDQANITERILFPGLDGLASWLKRQYKPVV